MPGNGCIAGATNRNRTGVTVDRHVPYSGIMQRDIKSDITVIDRDRPVASRRADQRLAFRNRHDQGARRVENVTLVRLGDWNSSFLVLEWGEDFDGLDISGIERHPYRPGSDGIRRGRGISGRDGTASAQ